jgi:uncharacterized protein YeaO (DUF488 family)
MTIKHDSIYAAECQTQPGLRVLIMRFWPRGVRKNHVDVWLRDAAPSRQLLRAYREGSLSWEDFEERYRAEIVDERADVLDQLSKLEREHGSVTLLCTERIPPREHCHRLTLQSLLAGLRP